MASKQNWRVRITDSMGVIIFESPLESFDLARRNWFARQDETVRESLSRIDNRITLQLVEDDETMRQSAALNGVLVEDWAIV